MLVRTPLPPPRRRSTRRACSLSPRRDKPPSSCSYDDDERVRDELRCPICFDMLCFPVTLPCGHNFDRGCLLTAWEHDATPAVPAAASHDRDSDRDRDRDATHACPLCRQRSTAACADDLRVNLLLKKLIASQFPVELQALECDAKCRAASAASTAASARPPSARRRRRTWRTAVSFLYVWLASVTEPPGFVLAVLLLMSLLAIAVTPQQMLTNASTLPTVFEGLDHILNAFLLLIREIAAQLDKLDLDVFPWLQVFSFLV